MIRVNIRKLFSKIDIYLFLVVIVSIVGMYALFLPGFIETHDSLFHLHRMIAFDQALQEGDFYPRWFPEFVLGYGYPVINFYAPFSYYVAEFFHLLGFGLSYSEKLTFAASLVLSGLTMYMWMVEAFGSRRAGFVAAVAYMYFPYRMVDIYVRGALAENVAFIFLPLLLWATCRIVGKDDRIHVVTAGVTLALLVLTHNITALFFLPVWLGYAAILLVSRPGVLGIGIKGFALKVLLVTTALVVGLAMSSFYWLPALQEQIYVSTSNFKDVGSDPVTQISAYHDLIQTSWTFDYIQRPIKAGFVQMIVFVIGVFGLLFLLVMGKPFSSSTRPYITQGLYFLLLAVAGILMMSPLAIPIWETVPLISFIQFPWRLLGFVGLGTSVLVGLMARTGKSFWFIALPSIVALAFFSMYDMPFVRTYLSEADLTIPEAVRYEFDSGVFGGTASAEYIPAWAKSGFSIPRDNPAARVSEKPKPPSNLGIIVRDIQRGQYKLAVASEQGGPLRLHQFYFPGWQGKIDGQATGIYPSTSLGLVTIDVPPGDHEVELFFGDSFIRYAARIVSLLATIGLAAVYLTFLRRRLEVSNFSIPVLSLAVTALFYVAVGAPEMPKTVSGTELPAYSFRSERFDLGSLRLVGFEFDSRNVVKEGKLRAVLYWQSLGGSEDSRIRLRILDTDGNVVGSRTTRPVYGTARTYLWSTDELVKDEVWVPIETAIEPGRYTLELSIIAGGDQLGTANLGTTSLPKVKMERVLPEIRPVDIIFGGKMHLLGDRVSLSGGKDAGNIRTALSPGDRIDTTLYWKTLEDMDTDYTVFLHFVDAKGKLWTQEDNQPRAGFGRTSQWLRGELLEDRYPVTLPKKLPPGVYRLEMGIYYLRTMERMPIDGRSGNVYLIGRFKVPPAGGITEKPARTLEAALGGSMRLTGVSIGDGPQETPTVAVRPGQENHLPVKLFWRAEREMEKDYTVFIHVLDASGKVVAQVDRQPMGGAYPTTFWSPGEVILDEYDIILPGLPPGEYQLRAGAYLLENLMRLPAANGEDSVAIGKVRVE